MSSLTETAVRVLLVDGDAVWIRALLSEAPGEYEIDAVSGGRDALRALDSRNPDVCLVDDSRDTVNGADLICEASAAGLRVPFLVLTEDERGVDVTVPQAGVDRFPKRELTSSALARSIRYAIRARSADVRLRQQEAFAQVGQLAVVVAQEMRNALAGVGGALQIIRNRLPDGGEERLVTDDIQVRLKSLHEMIEELLIAVDPAAPQLTRISLEMVLADVARELQEDGAASMTISGRAALFADPVLLRRLFHDVCQKACELSPKGGAVPVKVSTDGQWVAVVVGDRGGRDSDERRGLSPRRPTESSLDPRLELRAAQRVVDAYGGSLTMNRADRGGVVIEVFLPARGPVCAEEPR